MLNLINFFFLIYLIAATGYLIITTVFRHKKFIEDDRVRALKKEIINYLEDVAEVYQESADSYKEEGAEYKHSQDIYQAQADVIKVCANDIKRNNMDYRNDIFNK